MCVHRRAYLQSGVNGNLGLNQTHHAFEPPGNRRPEAIPIRSRTNHERQKSDIAVSAGEKRH
jgi:hypothetical protein